jgi:hypothetical protein
LSLGYDFPEEVITGLPTMTDPSLCSLAIQAKSWRLCW